MKPATFQLQVDAPTSWATLAMAYVSLLPNLFALQRTILALWSHGASYVLALCYSGLYHLFCPGCSSWIIPSFNTVPLHFPPTIPPNPSHPNFPPLILPLFVFVHVSFVDAPENSSFFSPHYPLLCPFYLLSVLYFHVSGYILLAYVFYWLGSTYGWDHVVFVFHHLAYFT